MWQLQQMPWHAAAVLASSAAQVAAPMLYPRPQHAPLHPCVSRHPQVAACGKGSLAALADWKPPTVTPLAEPKHRAPKGGAAAGHDEHSEAFTAAAVSTLFDRH